MPNVTEQELSRLPLRDRRGVWTTWGGDRWEAILIEGPTEEVTRRLERATKVASLHQDVRQSLINGTLEVPDGDWLLLVELHGTPWVHVLNSPDDLEFAPQLQRLAKRRVLQTGHESTSGYTYVQVHNRNGCSLTFQSNQVRHGKGTSETESHASTKLVSRKYPKRWLDQFNETADIHQALIRDLDAYVPMLQWIAEGEHLRVDACHADAADAENVASATLVLFGEKRPRSGLAANTAMLKAILAEDPAGTRAALASGASLETLPNFRCPPLCRALSHWKKNPSQAKQVVQVLLQAGADPNNGGSNGPPPIFVAIGTHNAQQKLGASFVDLLADAGADINRYHQERESLGWTPLHAAISDTNDAAVRVLIEHSADVFAVDHEGKTPREFLIERRSFILDFLGPDRSKKRIRQLDLCENMVIAAEGKRNR